MKNITLAKLVEEAKNLGCSLVPGSKIKLIMYNMNGLDDIKFFDSKDENCEFKIREKLKEIKKNLIGDFYEMSGSLYQLGLSMSDDQGEVYIYKEVPNNAIKTFPCNPTGLRQMVDWVSDALIEHCEDSTGKENPKIRSQGQNKKIAANPTPNAPEEDLNQEKTPVQEKAAPKNSDPKEVPIPSNLMINLYGLRGLGNDKVAGIYLGLLNTKSTADGEITKLFANFLEKQNDGE